MSSPETRATARSGAGWAAQAPRQGRAGRQSPVGPTDDPLERLPSGAAVPIGGRVISLPVPVLHVLQGVADADELGEIADES